jgi:hypothetical protein
VNKLFDLKTYSMCSNSVVIKVETETFVSKFSRIFDLINENLLLREWAITLNNVTKLDIVKHYLIKKNYTNVLRNVNYAAKITGCAFSRIFSSIFVKKFSPRTKITFRENAKPKIFVFNPT